MPLWQGPDEPAHFAYVQYMEGHGVPPRQIIVAPGRAAWQFSPSPAELASIDLTQRNQILTNPQRGLSITAHERARVLEQIAAASHNRYANQPGSQNYVAIYPPLYYQTIALAIRGFDIVNVTTQAYLARMITALWLGMAGVLWDIVLAFIVFSRPLRLAMLSFFVLMFPTFQMLGGVIGNDMPADAASLAIFALALWAIAKPKTLVTPKSAIVFGVVTGLAILTKEEAYIALVVSLPFVIWSVWSEHLSSARKWLWLGTVAVSASILAGPWLALTFYRYHALVPPLTYQGLGSSPHSLAWVLGSEFLSGSFELNLLVTQTVFGVDFPWWVPWHASLWRYRGLAMIWIVLLVGGFYVSRKQKGWGLSLAWIVVGVMFLWGVQWQYDMTTGAPFLQGRYFFFLLAPVGWIGGQLMIRLPHWGRTVLFVLAFVLSGLAINHTLWRYYHASIGEFVLGRIVMFAPHGILLISRIGVLTSVGIMATIMVQNVFSKSNKQELDRESANTLSNSNGEH